MLIKKMVVFKLVMICEHKNIPRAGGGDFDASSTDIAGISMVHRDVMSLEEGG